MSNQRVRNSTRRIELGKVAIKARNKTIHSGNEAKVVQRVKICFQCENPLISILLDGAKVNDRARETAGKRGRDPAP